MVMTLKVKNLRDMTRCSAVNVYRRFRRACRIHLVSRISQGGEKWHTIQETKYIYPSPEPIIYKHYGVSRSAAIGKVTMLHIINPLKTNGRLLYVKTQSVPRSKHFSSRL